MKLSVLSATSSSYVVLFAMAIVYLLGDKMNLIVRLGKQFPESSSCLHRQLGTGQQGRYISGTLIKQFT